MSHCEGCNGCSVDEKVVLIAKKYISVDGGIIAALHEVQDEYGYIPESVQKYLSKELDVPMSDIYGIITFYSRFSLLPKGKYSIEVCMGTACYVKGAEDVLNTFKDELKIKEGEITKDGKFSLECIRCIGACGLAPAIVINEEVYGKMSPDKVREVLSKYN
ncbi:MAG: NAD(P)H-dependent oxidoreductase subunit E [Clostridia bacterium]|nr:NAD(P)H-dependent oxidoreductase subunit E [Clostridia bacterium]MDD4386773.1 NAD(P)H-dependent oxidoreductase subunit E [Clostridia bacterium]